MTSTTKNTSVRPEPLEWMSNDASTSCLICSKLWSMKNRRHHCRRLEIVTLNAHLSIFLSLNASIYFRCGRLVCNECSMRTMAFDDSEEPKRICDGIIYLYLYFI